MELVTGQFNDSYPPIMDGVANVTKNYAYWLNKKCGPSYVITPTYPGYRDEEDFEVLRYFSLPLLVRRPYRIGLPQLDYQFKRLLYDIPFDIAHAHCPFSAGQIAFDLARKKGIPLVATFHSKFYDDFKAALKLETPAQIGLRRVMNFFRAADSVWTVNKATAQTLIEYGYKGPIEVVYNGTDFTPPSDQKEKKEAVNQLLNINSEETVFLFVGQHVWQKNLRMLIYALKTLKEMGISFKMIFAGAGYAEEDLKELSRELGLAKQTNFLGMVLDRELLKALFVRADLFLFPSIYDNAPIVVREAAAANCPAVLIAGANSAEGISDNINGFLAENDPLLYAQRIREILLDREKLLLVGKNAQQTVYKHWEEIVDEVKLRYLDLIREFNRKRSSYLVSG